MLAINSYRSRAPGLTDLLNWAAVVDSGVVQTKCGALLAGFYYRGLDVDCATFEQRNQATAVVNSALTLLGSGWATWADTVRVPAAQYPAEERSHFAAAIPQQIERERRETFLRGNYYVSESILTVMYTPPHRSERAAKQWVTQTADADKRWPTEILGGFKTVLDELEDRLSSAIDIRRMGNYQADGRYRDELLDYLNFCLTGVAAAINIPPGGMYLDAVLGAADFTPGNTPQVSAGDTTRSCCIIGLVGFPSESFPNMLEGLENYPVAYRWSTRMLYLETKETLAELSKYRRQWKQKSRGFFSQLFQTQGGVVNEDALAMAAQAESAMNEAHSDTVKFGYYTSTIIISDVSSEQALLLGREVKKEIQRKGFVARIETINATEAFLGSLPGHPHPNIRRPLIHTLNAADLMPLSSVWAGRDENPCPLYQPNSPALLQASATGATPFRLNIHQGDVGHTLIFGPTGAGKSVLLNTLAVQFLRYKNASIFAFDRGRSMETLVRGCDGLHIELVQDTEEQIYLAPLDALETESDVAWAKQWIADCYILQTETRPTVEQNSAISHAINLLRKAGQGNRSITEFCATVQDTQIRAALQQYSLAERGTAQLDAREDNLALSNFTVFEIDELLSTGEKNYLPLLSYLFRRIEKSLQGKPSLLCLGEAWALLSHPVFREKIREWLKTLRKANCAVILETQSLSDATRSGLFDVLVESCPTRILLPNPEADKTGTEAAPGPRDYYAMMGLNDADIEIIKSALPKRHYYYTSPEGKRLFDLSLGPVACAFVAISSKDDLAERAQFEKDHGAAWPARWIERRSPNA